MCSTVTTGRKRTSDCTGTRRQHWYSSIGMTTGAQAVHDWTAALHSSMWLDGSPAQQYVIGWQPTTEPESDAPSVAPCCQGRSRNPVSAFSHSWFWNTGTLVSTFVLVGEELACLPELQLSSVPSYTPRTTVLQFYSVLSLVHHGEIAAIKLTLNQKGKTSSMRYLFPSLWTKPLAR